jgi:beta-glucanase (GH16 family)
MNRYGRFAVRWNVNASRIVSRWRLGVAALAALVALAAAAVVLLAPTGTTARAFHVKLLSQGRPVTTSSVESPELTGDRAVDGDTRTRWASAAGHGTEWIAVDLGRPVAVDRAVLMWDNAYARGYLLEISDDTRNWRQLYATDTGDGQTDDLTVKGFGRYVRVFGTERATGRGYSLWELRLYGHPDPGGTPSVSALPSLGASPTVAGSPGTSPAQVPGGAPGTTGTPPAPPDGWRLTWSDEFTGSAGTPPDPAKWTYDLGGEPRWGNQEWEYYTDRPENASLDGEGSLAITARRETLPGMAGCRYGSCDITSARLKTLGRFAQRYGRFEARIRIPGGAGMWPAFWMMGDDIDGVGWPYCGEIDVMEIVERSPGTVDGTIHGPGFAGSGLGGTRTLPGGARFADAFHTFAIEWSPESVTWLLDGAPYLTVSKAQAPTWVYDHPFFILLNLAVGGQLPGSPAASTVFPARMLVDYVRVYQR